jgi:hypothetical protein
MGPGGGFRGAGGPPTGGFPGRFQATPPSTTGGFPAAPGGAATDGFGGARGGMGGLLDAQSVSSAVEAALSRDASSYTWVAAAVGANSAAGYQLATELPVMPVGGFNGSDPSPTLAQFQAYAESGQIHWFIGGGMGMGSDGGSSAASEIAAWVADTFAARTVDGVTLYDLTQPLGT